MGASFGKTEMMEEAEPERRQGPPKPRQEVSIEFEFAPSISHDCDCSTHLSATMSTRGVKTTLHVEYVGGRTSQLRLHVHRALWARACRGCRSTLTSFLSSLVLSIFILIFKPDMDDRCTPSSSEDES